ncbi:MAG: 16S rRNA (uracil(1498)-N(3))-methyltransferase [Crocinitomicaceae bacterium]|nr:16S rRNA (uracil(1498)-N(3))-methyltransferase [Crocinitomicaceae bacterium]
MRLFYDPNIDPKAISHKLSEEESKHIIKVLRMSLHDTLAIIDGNGHYFETKIIEAHPKRCTVEIISIDVAEASNDWIHIAVCPTKQIDRTEWFIEKATEIGVDEISFISSKNSERVNLKLERLQKKAISAMKQSKRRFLPKINDLQSIKTFLDTNPNGLLAHCYESKKSQFEAVYQKNNCPILIGPEGDFSEQEVEMALEKGYKTITLGKNRLRTETAALYACMRAKINIDNG